MEFSRSSSSSTKIERKVIEKNRRNQMKNLFSKLNSLLPNHNTTESLSLPDQIDEAINYIKSLEERLKKSKEKKERLTGRKRSYGCEESTSSSRSPQLEIKEMGSALEVVLVTELDTQFMFNEVIRILHEESVEVVNASFSVVGNSSFHVVHAKMRESNVGFGATKVRERLNRYIKGSTSEEEIEHELWDFGAIDPRTWDF